MMGSVPSMSGRLPVRYPYITERLSRLSALPIMDGDDVASLARHAPPTKELSLYQLVHGMAIYLSRVSDAINTEKLHM